MCRKRRVLVSPLVYEGRHSCADVRLRKSVSPIRQNGVVKYVDLFAGCGGLSLGIERAGGELVVAVEKSDMAARTFYHNLIGDASDPLGWARYVA